MTMNHVPNDPTKGSPITPAPSLSSRLRDLFGIGKTFTISASLLTAAIVTVGLFLFMQSAPPTTVIITSGPEGSVFQTNAFRYATFLARHGIKTKVLNSHGSWDNLQRLADPSVQVDVGFVQGGVTNEHMHELVSLGSVAYQPLLVFYRGTPIELLSGLEGRRVAIGPPGSGTRTLALTLLEANGIKPGGTTTLLDWEPTQSSKALLDGSVDAAFLMGEDASPAVLRELLRASNIHLLSFKQAMAYTRRLSYLSVLELPQGSIDFGKNIPAQDVHLIGPTVELIARKKLHPALSDFLLEAAREVHGHATLLQHKNEFPAPLEHDFRLSIDAARYYKSGRSFFYRYLPFWLASLTSRIVVVIVPMIVVLIPAMRSIPFLYRWRVRSRIFRWYRALLHLERELFSQGAAADRGQLLQRLDAIEQAVNTMKVPASFADQFYGLRQHIGFVRELVEATPAGSAEKSVA